MIMKFEEIGNLGLLSGKGKNRLGLKLWNKSLLLWLKEPPVLSFYSSASGRSVSRGALGCAKADVNDVKLWFQNDTEQVIMSDAENIATVKEKMPKNEENVENTAETPKILHYGGPKAVDNALQCFEQDVSLMDYCSSVVFVMKQQSAEYSTEENRGKRLQSFAKSAT
ncbi:hypothetical protein TNCV_3219491 [Trichonephila clavipes]|nr:hypothetical protein TNCV_3219491 [Trichonephila clavipes]